MTTTILGVFDDALTARRAMEALRDGPLPLEDLSIISRQTESGDAVSDSDDVSAGEGAAVGAVWGGLVGLGALLIPGVGPFIAGGALFAALTGAVTGAVVGGITAALVDFGGISAEEAEQYEQQIQAGKTLLAVKARDEDALEVRRVMVEYGADEMHENDPSPATAGVASAPPTLGSTASASATATPMTSGAQARANPPRVAMYDSKGGRMTPEMNTASVATPIADPMTGGTQSVGRDQPVNQTGTQWTRGEVVGEGQGAGPRTNTGTYDADQWAGETQRPGETPGNTWTSGEFVGEGQGAGPRSDTGTEDSRQWVGEGQGGSTPSSTGTNASSGTTPNSGTTSNSGTLPSTAADADPAMPEAERSRFIA